MWDLSFIKAGDKVTIETQHRKQRTGHAVMYNQKHNCWALNLGGTHGTPGVACQENLVRVMRGKKLIYGA